jgi:hypothetical protein
MGLGRDRLLARDRVLAGPAGARLRPEQLDRGRVHVLHLRDADRPGEAPLAEAPAERGAHAVAGVGQHAAEAGAGGDDPVDLGESEVGLRRGAAVLLGHARVGTAPGVGGPCLGQEQAQPDRHRHLAPGQRERDQGLAVGPLA